MSKPAISPALGFSLWTAVSLSLTLAAWPNRELGYMFWLAAAPLSYVSQHIFIFCHEAGHALAARLLGYGVSSIDVGEGRTLATWQKGAQKFTLRLWPNSGLVMVRHVPLEPTIFRPAIFAISGVAAQFGAGAALFWFLFKWHPADTDAQALRHFLLWLTCLFNLAVIFANLRDCQITISGQDRPSDGSLLFGLWRTKSARLKAFRLVEATASDAPINPTLKKQAAAALDEINDDAQAIAFANLIGQSGRRELLWCVLDALLDRLPPDHAHRAELIDSAGSLALFARLNDAMQSARLRCAGYLESRPHLLSLRGTLGGLMFELGDYAEAERELQACLSSPSPHDQGICFAYLGMLRLRQGRTVEAENHFHAAEQFQTAHPEIPLLLARLSSALGAR